jgi:hypothetical protein
MKVTLARLTLVAWAAWLLTLGIMVWLACWRALHPSFLYMAVPLAVQVICTVAVLGGGIWRVVRGPRRWNAVAWMLFAFLPTLWMAAYIEYLLVLSAGRTGTPNLLTKWAEPMSSLIGEPYVRVCYPFRYEGERFVMWSDSPEFDVKAMAAMDAHILAMEQFLGHRSDYKVYWVRGPVWGIEGRAVFGWALGSRSSTPADAADGLNSMDRHEVAHIVVEQFSPKGDGGPKLLHEGWAELHAKPKPESRWEECWFSQQEGKLPSLRALTNPEWYYNSIEPMYTLGSVLVEYILKRFGPEKFIELGCTCRQATFPDDVERVLGVSLDELDRDYQQDLAQRELSPKESLLSAKLADGIDKSRWRRLVEGISAGLGRFVSASDRLSITVVEKSDSKEKDGHAETGQRRSEYFFNGKRYAKRRFFSEGSDVIVRTPDVVFGLEKKPDNKAWQLRSYSVRSRESEVAMPRLREKPMPLWYPWPWLPSGPGLTITGIHARDADSRVVRVSYAETREGGGQWARMQGWIDLDPKYDYGIIEKKFDCFDDKGNPTSSSDVTIHYETIDGKRVPKTICSESHGLDGSSSRRETTVESCRLGPPPAKVFELSSYGDYPLPGPPHEPRFSVPMLTWVVGGFTLLALVLALCLSLKKWIVGKCRVRPPALTGDGNA